MSGESDSFLSRWSRRKLEAAREAERRPAAPAPEVADASAQRAGEPPQQSSHAALNASAAPVTETGAGAPTAQLPPVESLDGLRSDYVAYFQQSVEESLKRAALKKLVSDPHFNQMDGLDVYIDDYSQFEPLTEETRLRLLSSSEFLNRLEQLPDALGTPAQTTPAAPTESANDADLAEAPPVENVIATQSEAAPTSPAVDEPITASATPSAGSDAPAIPPEPDSNRTP